LSCIYIYLFIYIFIYSTNNPSAGGSLTGANCVVSRQALKKYNNTRKLQEAWGKSKDDCSVQLESFTGYLRWISINLELQSCIAVTSHICWNYCGRGARKFLSFVYIVVDSAIIECVNVRPHLLGSVIFQQASLGTQITKPLLLCFSLKEGLGFCWKSWTDAVYAVWQMISFEVIKEKENSWSSLINRDPT